jgi:hypothetical protein
MLYPKISFKKDKYGQYVSKWMHTRYGLRYARHTESFWGSIWSLIIRYSYVVRQTNLLKKG